MRYSFDNEAMSFINRVYNAILNKAAGTDWAYKGEYVAKEMRLCSILWFEADRIQDWGAETDAVMDAYPKLAEAWHEMMRQMREEDAGTNDNVGEAENVACDFENKLHLACCVVNALDALEGGGALVDETSWGEESLKAINKEFEADRERIARRINDILSLPITR
jgi:hypothetical protein